ncbi:MAG TPA: tol-pal system protein YbgF [Gallionellaceae bacterium]|nr:tol-pal system protein YbgF [Gallionellaceae bacterium]
MNGLRLWLCAGLCLLTAQASAGLFTDDEAHKQIEQLEARIASLEESYKQQTSSMLDLLSQVETLNQELRKLRGQNEELVHNLQDAEKRQKDFYVDLDARVRRFETTAESAAAQQPAAAQAPQAAPAAAAPKADDSQAQETAAYDEAFGFYKTANYEKALVAFRDFLKKYPDSSKAPNVHYLMGNAYFALEDFKRSIASYQVVVSKYESNAKVPDAWLNIAGCQQKLEDVAAARKTLKQLIAKYPDSQAAAKAKKRLAALK